MRQKIISGRELEDHKQEVLHEELSLVLKNGVVHFLICKEISQHQFIGKDLLSHKLKFALTDIEEVILDVKDA